MWKLIQLNMFKDNRGVLTWGEMPLELPFEVKRFYFLSDASEGIVRGRHAHLKLQQLLIVVSGSCDVFLSDGITSECLTLQKHGHALLIQSGVWRELTNFSSDCVCFVLASELYSEEDYIHNFDEFVSAQKRK